MFTVIQYAFVELHKGYWHFQRRISLPFVPFLGLRIFNGKNPENMTDDGGMVVKAVSWNVSEERFSCEMEHKYLKGCEKDEWLSDGWEEINETEAEGISEQRAVNEIDEDCTT